MRGSPMAVDDDGEPGRGLKRQREEDSDDKHPLIFKHMKRINTENVLETSEDEEGDTGGRTVQVLPKETHSTGQN